MHGKNTVVESTDKLLQYSFSHLPNTLLKILIVVKNREEVEYMPKSKRGLASASEETRRMVGQKGGKAKHSKRGLQAANAETRRRVAQMGGRA